MIHLVAIFQAQAATKRSDSEFASGITFRDLCGNPNVPTLAGCFLKPKHESAPRKVRMSHIMRRDNRNLLKFGWFLLACHGERVASFAA